MDKITIGPPAVHFWKISHGTASTGLSKSERDDCEKRNVITMHRQTKGFGGSKILQGDIFEYAPRKGDIVYLCHASAMRRLVQIADDTIQENPKPGFIERPYRVIAEAKKIGKYPAKGFRKQWTPNHNSTFVQIPPESYTDFNSHILKPFFETNVGKLEATAEAFPVERRYWWLNANPKMWEISKQPIGKEQSYTLFNEDGNPRREYSAFLGCREGDLFIGYEGGTNKHVCAILECTKAQNGKEIFFKKLADLSNPVTRAEVMADELLATMTPVITPQGSLFEISDVHFKELKKLIQEKNPGFEIIEEQNANDIFVVPDAFSDNKYSKADFLKEVFLSSEQYDDLVELLKRKKNIILQGAPGVGKTFAARRLAYSLIGKKDETRAGFVQFHQSYSYEDFICGYKPTKDGGFILKDGLFLKFCKKANDDPDHDYYFIIDEINRGNLSKIFGELLVLIEADKRGDSGYAVKLAYRNEDEEKCFCVPTNLYLIGLMNTADRSLAMIDYALRRRFSFYTMEPALMNQKFRSQLTPELTRLVTAVETLNQTIADDPGLGKGFQIGHSYFCPGADGASPQPKEIVKFEIGPMLEEYWFEDPEKALRETENLLKVTE